jgi:hypothetical protein
MSQEVFRIEEQNTHFGTQGDINFGGGFIDDAASFWRIQYQPSAADAGGATRNGILLVSAIPPGQTVGSSIVGIQACSEVQGTANGDQAAFFGVAEVDAVGASAHNLYAFIATTDCFSGNGVTGECALFTGTLINTSGAPIHMQAGVDIGANGNCSNRYGIYLRDFQGTVSSENYGIKQLGITGNRKNLFNANTTIGIADIPLQNGAPVMFGVVGNNTNNADFGIGIANYDSTPSSGNGSTPGLTMGYSRNNTVGGHGLLTPNDFTFVAYGLGDDGTFMEQCVALWGRVDGTPAANSMPGRWEIATTNPGSISATVKAIVDSLGNVVVNTGSVSNTATHGFLYIPTCTGGAPTGVPTSYSGRVAMVYDITNHKFWIYDTASSAWRGVVLT